MFNLLKKNKNTLIAPPEVKNNYKAALDEIQSKIFIELKDKGFKKKGRTFNRKVDENIIQVINFQSGKYELKPNKSPAFFIERNLYGKFTINIGVVVLPLRKLETKHDDEPKSFYQEYECLVRTRLPMLVSGEDDWWNIDLKALKTIEDINNIYIPKGLKWLEQINSIDKIIENLGKIGYGCTPRYKFDIALLVWTKNKEQGHKLCQEYYDSLIDEKQGHKNYIKELTKKIGINLIDKSVS